MVVTLTVNPCVDLSLAVEDLVKDDAVRITDFKKYAGGKGICVSRAIKRLGGDALTITMLGGRAGEEVRSLLDAEGIRSWTVNLREETRTNLIIYERGDRTLTRLHMRGPLVQPMELDELRGLVRGIPTQSGYLVMGGSLLGGFPDDFYAEIIVQAREKGMRVILDSDGKHLELGLEAKPFMIKPNEFELERLVGKPLPTVEELVAACREILARGVEMVVVSRGSKGAVAVTETQVVEVIPPPIKNKKSTVGSGDSMVAGIVHAMFNGEEDLGRIMALGAAAGTATAHTPGTELCYKNDIDRLLGEVRIHWLEGSETSSQ